MGAFFVFFLKSLPQSLPYFHLIDLEILKLMHQLQEELH